MAVVVVVAVCGGVVLVYILKINIDIQLDLFSVSLTSILYTTFRVLIQLLLT